VNAILNKLLVGLSPNLQLNAVGDKDDLIFYILRLKGHDKSKHGQKCTLGILKVMGVKVTDSFSGEGIPVNCLLLSII